MTKYKGWTFGTSCGQVRIVGYGTAGTFASEIEAVAWIDANFP